MLLVSKSERQQPLAVYRARPMLFNAVIVKNFLVDLDGTNLHFFELDNFKLVSTIEVLEEQDQYCTRLIAVGDDNVVVLGAMSLVVVSVSLQRTFETISLSGLIERVCSMDTYLAIISFSATTDEAHVLHFMEIKDNKIVNSQPPFEIYTETFVDCTDERLDMVIIEKEANIPTVYVFWKETNQLIEIKPLFRAKEKLYKNVNVHKFLDLDHEFTAMVFDSFVSILNKVTWKETSKIVIQSETLKNVSYDAKQKFMYTISDKSIQRWRIERNSVPVEMARPTKGFIEELYFTERGVYGISTENKMVAFWESPEKCRLNNFSTEAVRKIMHFKDSLYCLIIESTTSTEENNEFQVCCSNKLEIINLEKPQEPIQRIALKKQLRVNVDSAVVSGDVVGFILHEENGQQTQAYLARWHPTHEVKSKVLKPRRLPNFNTYKSIKLYDFNRMMTISVENPESKIYSPLGSSKATTCIKIFDLSAADLGSYRFTGDVKDVELSRDNKIYVMKPEILTIYKFDALAGSTINKIYDLEISVSFLKLMGSGLLFLVHENQIRVYDEEHQLIMKRKLNKDSDPPKILQFGKSTYIVTTRDMVRIWNVEEETQRILNLPARTTNLIEVYQDKIVTADRHIQVFAAK